MNKKNDDKELDILDQVLTSSEACALWNMNESTLRRAFTTADKRFHTTDYRKSGKVWIVKKTAMVRVYGPMPEKNII